MPNEHDQNGMWGFIHCKEKTAFLKGYGPEVGDCYVFTAIERTTKLVLAFHCGKRDVDNTEYFASKLNMSGGLRQSRAVSFLPTPCVDGQ
ncbi:MAG: hypothetical protein FJ303_27720 [Planctomycetes bacterium]|nr:hypothetical protein [Planctomycetota bacterium]